MTGTDNLVAMAPISCHNRTCLCPTGARNRPGHRGPGPGQPDRPAAQWRHDAAPHGASPIRRQDPDGVL